MSTALPPLLSVTEILLMKKEGSLTMEQKWNLRFLFMRKPDKALTVSMCRNMIGTMIRHYVVIANEGDVVRGEDMKNEIVWCVKYLSEVRNVSLGMIRFYDSEIAGFVPRGDTTHNSPGFVLQIADLNECGIVFSDNTLGKISTTMRDFYEI